MAKKESSPSLVNVRDRVKEFRRVPAKLLRANPKNWRTHPETQRETFRALAEQIGFASAVLARELPDGGLELIDGHLRIEELPPESDVPTLVLDVTEAEADTILLTFDPLSQMANADAAALESLLGSVPTTGDRVGELFASLAKEHDVRLAASEQALGAADVVDIRPIYQVLVECRDEAEQRELYEQLTSQRRRVRLLTV